MYRLKRELAPKLSSQERERLLQNVLQAVVDCLHPVQVYAVGSILTDSFDDSSDVDLVVVFASLVESRNSWRKRSEVRSRALCAIDLIPFSVEEFEEKKELGGMAYVAFHEGRQVYPY